MALDDEHLSLQSGDDSLRMVIEVCWRLREPSGRILECRIYQTDVGLEVRAEYGPRVLRWSALTGELESARARAHHWRRIMLHPGSGFEDLPIR
jgi:hypothetical protein